MDEQLTPDLEYEKRSSRWLTDVLGAQQLWKFKGLTADRMGYESISPCFPWTRQFHIRLQA